MRNEKNREQICAYLLAIAKTFSAGLGAIVFRNGKALIFLDDMTTRYDLNNKTIQYPIVGVLSASVFYTIARTRFPSLWEKFKPRDESDVVIRNNDAVTVVTERDDNEIPVELSKSFKGLAYVVFISRAPFHALNTYAGAYAILNLINPKNINILSVTIGLYITVSSLVTYFAYTFESIKKNCQKIAKSIQSRSETKNEESAIATVLNTGMKIFLNSGALSFGALSFFIAEKGLLTIPYIRQMPILPIRIIAGMSAITGIASCILSKNMELNHFVDEGAIKFIKKTRNTNSCLIYLHSAIGLIFSICMGIGYFDGSLNIFDSLNISKTKFLSEHQWLLLTVAAIFALSGAIMDFAFSAKPMIELLIKKNEHRSENTSSFFAVDESNIQSTASTGLLLRR